MLLLWTVPAYLVCEVVSTSWHIRMAQRMAATTDGGGGGDSIQLAADVIYTRLVYVAFLLQVPAPTPNPNPSPASPPPQPQPQRARSFPCCSYGCCSAVLTMATLTVLTKVRLLGTLVPVPLLGVGVSLLLSALLHSYDCFELSWSQQGRDVMQRFRIIEEHWLYFLGYGALLATLSVLLRFWDLFVIRTVLYPIYIANAPYARFDSLRCRPLPVFQLAFGVINGGLQLVELRTRKRA